MKKYIFTFLTVLACLWGNEGLGQVKYYGLMNGPVVFSIDTEKRVWLPDKGQGGTSIVVGNTLFTINKSNITTFDLKNEPFISTNKLQTNLDYEFYATPKYEEKSGLFISYYFDQINRLYTIIAFDKNGKTIWALPMPRDYKRFSDGSILAESIAGIRGLITKNGATYVLYNGQYEGTKLLKINTDNKSFKWSLSLDDYDRTYGIDFWGDNIYIKLNDSKKVVESPDGKVFHPLLGNIISPNGVIIDEMDVFPTFKFIDITGYFLGSERGYFLSEYKLICYNFKTKTIEWVTNSSSTLNPVSSIKDFSEKNQIIIVGVYLGAITTKPSIMALDAITGKTIWQRDDPYTFFGGGGISIKTFDDKMTVFTEYSHQIKVYDLRNPDKPLKTVENAGGTTDVLLDVIIVQSTPVQPTLNLSATAQNAVATANTANITLTTNNTWTASSNVTWLKVSPTTGNAGTNLAVNFTIDANTATTARTGVVTFTAGGLTQTFTVTQAGVVAPTLTLSATAQNAVATATTASITLTTNNSWTASSNAAWLKVSPTSGNAGTNIAINFTIDANAATTARLGVVTFTAGGLTQTFTVTQAGVVAPTLTLSATAQNAVATATTASITLTTNNNWTASSNATWLKVSPTSGNAGTNLAINFTIDANAATTARTGVVTFSAGGLTKTFTVTQAGTIAPTLTLSATIQNAVATATTASITLTTNNNWTASSNATWLKVNPISGNAGTNLAISFTIDANTATTVRTGIVTFSAGGLTKTFTVTQVGTNGTGLNIDRGINIFSPVENGKYIAGAIIPISGFLKEGTLANKIRIVLKPKGKDQAIAGQIISLQSLSNYQLKVPENTPLGNYEVIIANASDNTLSKSVNIEIIPFIPNIIKIKSPNGGETIRNLFSQATSLHYPISWVTLGSINLVNIYYSADNGKNWVTIEENVANNGIYFWNISNITSSEKMLIKIIEANNDKVFDISDNSFTSKLFQYKLSFLQPNGGEIIEGGTVYSIRWNKVENQNSLVNIEISKDNGKTFTYLAKAIENSGEFKWVTPNENSSDLIIKVTNSFDESIFDTSDKVFIIKKTNNLRVYGNLYDVGLATKKGINTDGTEYIADFFQQENTFKDKSVKVELIKNGKVIETDLDPTNGFSFSNNIDANSLYNIRISRTCSNCFPIYTYENIKVGDFQNLKFPLSAYSQFGEEIRLLSKPNFTYNPFAGVLLGSERSFEFIQGYDTKDLYTHLINKANISKNQDKEIEALLRLSMAIHVQHTYWSNGMKMIGEQQALFEYIIKEALNGYLSIEKLISTPATPKTCKEVVDNIHFLQDFTNGTNSYFDVADKNALKNYYRKDGLIIAGTYLIEKLNLLDNLESALKMSIDLKHEYSINGIKFNNQEIITEAINSLKNLKVSLDDPLVKVIYGFDGTYINDRVINYEKLRENLWKNISGIICKKIAEKLLIKKFNDATQSNISLMLKNANEYNFSGNIADVNKNVTHYEPELTLKRYLNDEIKDNSDLQALYLSLNYEILRCGRQSEFWGKNVCLDGGVFGRLKEEGTIFGYSGDDLFGLVTWSLDKAGSGICAGNAIGLVDDGTTKQLSTTFYGLSWFYEALTKLRNAFELGSKASATAILAKGLEKTLLSQPAILMIFNPTNKTTNAITPFGQSLFRENPTFTLYPNPTTNQFSIDLKDLEGIPQMLIVNDEQGNMIFQKTVDAICCDNVQVHFPKSGIYTVLIQTNQGIVTKKIAVSQ
jgi:Putative binding domain, N-terminal/Viral BACON domain